MSVTPDPKFFPRENFTEAELDAWKLGALAILDVYGQAFGDIIEGTRQHVLAGTRGPELAQKVIVLIEGFAQEARKYRETLLWRA